MNTLQKPDDVGGEAAEAAPLNPQEERERPDEFSAFMAAAARVRPIEVVGVLASHLRADFALVLELDGTFDLAACRRRGVLHLIRRVKVRRRFTAGGEREESVELELHDAQRAALALARMLGLHEPPRQTERRQVERALAAYMAEAGCTREQAVADLSELSPVVAKYLAEE
jgi:hypothetical protein